MDAICELIVAEAGATIGLTRGAQWALPMKHFRYQLKAALQDLTTTTPVEVTPTADGRKMLAPAS